MLTKYLDLDLSDDESTYCLVMNIISLPYPCLHLSIYLCFYLSKITSLAYDFSSVVVVVVIIFVDFVLY